MASVLDKTYELLADAWASVRGVAVGFVDGDGKWSPASDAAPLPTTMRDGVTGSAVSFGFTPVGITTKTTTLVKTGAGMVGDITINKTGSADTITVYDALTATGTPIATITAPTVGMKFCELYKFATGLCIVTGGTTAGDYTVSYQ